MNKKEEKKEKIAKKTEKVLLYEGGSRCKFQLLTLDCYLAALGKKTQTPAYHLSNGPAWLRARAGEACMFSATCKPNYCSEARHRKPSRLLLEYNIIIPPPPCSSFRCSPSRWEGGAFVMQALCPILVLAIRIPSPPAQQCRRNFSPSPDILL